MTESSGKPDRGGVRRPDRAVFHRIGRSPALAGLDVGAPSERRRGRGVEWVFPRSQDSGGRPELRATVSFRAAHHLSGRAVRVALEASGSTGLEPISLHRPPRPSVSAAQIWRLTPGAPRAGTVKPSLFNELPLNFP